MRTIRLSGRNGRLVPDRFPSYGISNVVFQFGNPWLSRLASRVDSRAHSQLLIMLQLVLPGSNSFYYGDELGMKNLPNDSVVSASFLPPRRMWVSIDSGSTPTGSNAVGRLEERWLLDEC